MSNPAKLWIWLPAILAGCSTTPPEARPPRAADWETPGLTEAVQPVLQMPAPAAPQPPPPSPPPITNQIAETWVSLNRWAELNDFGACARLSSNSPAFAFTTDEWVVVFEVGSRSARWNGLTLQLGYAPRAVNNELLLHALDVQKNLLPLIGQTPPAMPARPVLVIDPGHGGTDPGAMCVANGHFEKEYTLDWARRLQRLLATNGWEVCLTRTNDANVPLAERVACAELHKANLFLSLHFNSASPSSSQAGLETYCLTPAGMPSNLTRGYDDDASLVFPNNAFDSENLQCAVWLHQALLAVNGNVDRGVRRARFLSVLRGQNRPAVMLEGGYLSNPREALQIADPAHRQKLAEAVANALARKSEDGGQEANAAARPCEPQPRGSSTSTTNAQIQ